MAQYDPTARTELPMDTPGEVERREREEAQDKSQTPVIPPHTAAEVAPAGWLDPQEIARLAYNYWLDRQHTGEGSAHADWLRAENELRRRSSKR